MGRSLDSCIEEANDVLDSLSHLYFKPPGIFHNTMMMIEGSRYKGLHNGLATLLRDAESAVELSTYAVADDKKSLVRRYGEKGPYEYLREREGQLKRNRRAGLPEPKPVIDVPVDLCLKLFSSKSGDEPNDSVFVDVPGTLAFDKTTIPAFQMLSEKFKEDTEILQFLEALKNGSTTVENSHNMTKSTMFVDDFSTDIILRVFAELATYYDENRYAEKYNELSSQYELLSERINNLKQKIEEQGRQMEEPPTSGAELIERRKQIIQDLKNEYEKLQKQAAASDEAK